MRYHAAAFFLLLLASTAAAAATPELSVNYMTLAAQAETTQAIPWFQVVNNGASAVDLSTITLRYWFTADNPGTSQVFNCDWAALGCNNLKASFVTLTTPINGANRYLQIGFAPGTPMLAPGANSGDIQTRFNDDGWLSFSQANDYSFNSSASSFAPAPRITLYANGQLIWGVPPGGIASTPSPKPTATQGLAATPSPTPTRSPTTTPSPRVTPTLAPTPAPPPPTPIIAPTLAPSPRPTPTPAPTPTAGAISLEVQYENLNTTPITNQAVPWVQLVNTGSKAIALSQITLRYWFTDDIAGVDQQFNCDWAALDCSNVSGRFVTLARPADGASKYLEIGFGAGAGTLAPGASTGQIQERFNYDGWIDFNQSEDYSFDPAASSFIPERRITAYYNGTLVWGIEPAGIIAPSPTPSAVPSAATPTPVATAVPSVSASVVPTGQPTPIAGVFPAHIFAPYVDVTLYPTFALAQQASNVSRFYSLAFIVDGGNCTASWGAVIPLSDTFLDPDIASLRAAGGDVIVSFGGEANQELAETCPSVAALQAQYEAVIERFQLKRIDFDIEGAAIAQAASIQKRDQALANLQHLHPGLQVTFTLPVMPYGLTQEGVALVADAMTRGVQITAVNVMAMDYGYADAQMGQDAINAAVSTAAQLAPLYPGKTTAQLLSMIGVTPMIGYNDVQGEVFQLTDALALLNYAQANHFNEIAMWSANRDQPCPAGQNGTTQNTCSGVVQSPDGFSAIFHQFNL
jgi:hypothetical protein